MWVPEKVIGLFQIAKESVEDLKQEVATLKSENAVLKDQLSRVNANFDWLKLRVNSLEVERAVLFEKATGVKVPVPEIVRPQNTVDQLVNQLSFEDMGDDLAKKFGLPAYS